MEEEKSVEETVTFKVEDAEEGQRLDKVLSAFLPDYSRTRLHRQIVEGDVLVNGSPSKPSYKVRAGDRVEVELPPPQTANLLPEPLPLDLLYEDEALIVVHKPAGMVVHPGAGVNSGTLANGLAWHFRELAGSGIRPGIVHRLDKDTSGVMVVAKTEAAHAHLSEQFAARTVEKHYTALVYGQPESEGRVELPIGRHPVARVKMAVVQGGRYALTLYKVARRFQEVALLDLEIKTGRTHQIRVHMSHIHHPVVADELYGSGYATRIRDVETRRVIEGLRRQLLHASSLRFAHPNSGERLEFRAALPSDFQKALDWFETRARL